MSDIQTFASTQFPGRTYQEKSILGHGGESIVYLVEAIEGDSSLGEFALKHLNHRALRNTTQGERILKRFERQVEIMRQLEHPNIVALVDAAVQKRLEEVKQYLKDATPAEREQYRTACKAFGYEEGRLAAAIHQQVDES